MRIYSIYASEDGLSTNCATNGKSLFDIIESSYADNYQPQIISVYCNEFEKWHELRYSYANVVKAINISSGQDKRFYAHFTIHCGGANLTINELKINS